MPENKRYLYNDLGLTREQIAYIIYNTDIDLFFYNVIQSLNATKEYVRVAANYICTDLSITQEDGAKNWGSADAATFSKLIVLAATGVITSRVAKDLLFEVVFEGKDPETLAKERGLIRNTSVADLTAVITQILAENLDVVAQVRSGKDTALQFLVGQAMKATKGSADPKILLELFKTEIMRDS